MLRRLLTAQGANPLQALCTTRWVGRGVTRVPARVPLVTTPKRRTTKTVPPSGTRGSTGAVVDSAAETVSPKRRNDTHHPAKSKARKAMKPKANTGVVKAPAKGRSTGQRSASNTKRTPVKPLERKSPGRAGKGSVKKGRPHAHAIQKLKYNKRVAAIAKLWRMRKKKRV